MITIHDEPIAIIAKRSEWAGLLCELGESRRFITQCKDNPETYKSAMLQATAPDNVFDVIAATVVDTQLRIEKGVPPNVQRVKIVKSQSLLREP